MAGDLPPGCTQRMCDEAQPGYWDALEEEEGLPEIGDNHPPSHIEFAAETAAALNDWLTSHPVVQTEEETREIKVLLDRSRLCRQDTEAERKSRVGPLQQQVRDINAEYAGPLAYLDKLELEAKTRLNVWIVKEEEKRRRAAEEARQRAWEAAEKAREAEAREREAAEDARQGVEADIGTATAVADAAFSDFQRAEREAARLEKAKDVKITGGFSRALSSRFKETLVVADPEKAFACMGYSERVLEAMLTEARDYRRKYGKLPDGIISQGERGL